MGSETLSRRIARRRSAIKRHEKNATRYRLLAEDCARWAMEERMALSLDLIERDRVIAHPTPGDSPCK